MGIHSDRVRFAAMVDRLRIPPPGPDPDVEAEALSALRLAERIMAQFQADDDLIGIADFHAFVLDLADLQRTARAAGGRPLPPVTRN